MIAISQALRDTVKGNPFLEFGFHHGLFNLTQLAGFLRPQVEARTKKPVRVSAVTMNLSRLRRELGARTPRPEQFVIEQITIHSGLCTLTYPKDPGLHAKLNSLNTRIHRESGFCSLSQGSREITVIIDSRYRAWLGEEITRKPLYQHDRLSSIGVEFNRRYVDIPGMLYMLIQRVALQNINLIEITSTYTEIMFFVDQADTQVVFDILFESFLAKSKARS